MLADVVISYILGSVAIRTGTFRVQLSWRFLTPPSELE
jgi:hypothetical protein